MHTEMPADAPQRAPYVPPALEPLGSWSALTLQQSFPLANDHFVGHTSESL